MTELRSMQFKLIMVVPLFVAAFAKEGAPSQESASARQSSGDHVRLSVSACGCDEIFIKADADQDIPVQSLGS
ncbi:hypothetical protein, partial [Rhizobium johnstonii]|uniref:hypothetical protein n=1 Tax=Rhizobium johnstonii TaxID=3019933 RepID=UPI003F9EA44F